MSQIEIPSRETGPEAPEQPAVHSNTENPAAVADTGINQVEPQEKPQERETPPRQPEQPENKEKREKQDDAPSAPKDQEQAADLLKDKSLDIADFEREFMAQGALSEESYKKLTEAGIPKSVVDSYIDGRMAVAQTFISEIQGLAGGPEQYADMVQWAGQNLPPEEIRAFDSLCCSGKKDMITLAVNGLVAKWRGAEGAEPAHLAGGSVSGGGSRDVFESAAQVVEAMRDGRYGSDPAYTRAVEAKMARSPHVFG